MTSLRLPDGRATTRTVRSVIRPALFGVPPNLKGEKTPPSHPHPGRQKREVERIGAACLAAGAARQRIQVATVSAPSSSLIATSIE